MARSATAGVRLTSAERSERALELRKAGISFSKIAAALGISKNHAHRLVQRHLTETRQRSQEIAEDVRELERLRLDDALSAIWTMVRQGNLGAIDRLVRIMERRARLLGLDAPARQEVSGPEGGPIDFVRRVAASEELTRAAHDFLEHVELSAGGYAVEPSGDGV